MQPLLSVSLVLLCCVTRSVYAFSNTGRTGILDGISYYAPPDPVASIGFQPLLQGWAGQLVPVTVVNSPDLILTSEAYANITNTFKASDDVWQSGFSKGMSL